MEQKSKLKKLMPYIVGGGLVILFIIGMSINKYSKPQYMSYNTFMNVVENRQIKQVAMSEGSMIRFQQLGDETVYETDHPRNENFKEILLKENIKVTEGSNEGLYVMQLIISASIFIGVFYIVFKGSGRKGGAQMMALNAKPIEPQQLKVGFDRIAGNVEAKEQVEDIINFIKTPEKYNQIGAKMPKGMIFYGPPGTGKTLMAKAVAKEAGVPFFAVSGSDFVQLYVGVGASRVREIFKEARKHQKAVIFIDEIDAIGKARSQSATNSNDEKDQTLNALLTEMSGFDGSEGIVVIGATNRLDMLDDALLRPGRFDRHIEIGYPDKNARYEIFKLYLKDKPMDDSVDIAAIAKQTVYFTGAMIGNLVNEAAILAANEESKVITRDYLERAFYIVIAGMEKKDRSHISEDERRITACHEAGHALITKLVAPENSVTKVTIVPTAKGAGGFSINIPKDKMYRTKKELISQIQISLAGRIAEEIVFGEDAVTTGASNDLEKATMYLKDYMSKYGMHKELGVLNMQVLYGKESIEDSCFVEACKETMQRIYEETKTLMFENQIKLTALSDALLEEETLDENSIDALLAS